SPFATDEDVLLFLAQLRSQEENDIVPTGLAVHPSEWGNEQYPTHETLKMRRGQVLEMELPFEIWWPRAVQWARAL
ncbi:hypothetical protein DL96DRAFT_1448500, partial [Flagelloscypha sp. PMI_526]